MSTALRHELEKLPERMRDLPVHRGYPVPWFVDWVTDEAGENVPEFRAMDGRKFVRAVKEKRCWVCGDKLGGWLTFVIGPMCGINRVSAEPPSHLECAGWSARNCPFLSRPHMERRDVDPALGALKPAGCMIERNPGVMLLWTTRTYEVFRTPKGVDGYLISIGDPESISFWTEGRQAMRAEIDASVQSGLPLLAAADGLSIDDPDFVRAVGEFQELLPA